MDLDKPYRHLHVLYRGFESYQRSQDKAYEDLSSYESPSTNCQKTNNNATKSIVCNVSNKPSFVVFVKVLGTDFHYIDHYKIHIEKN